MLLHVWWPLAATGGLLLMTVAEVAPGWGSLARAVVGVIAIAGIAITYEADRLHFTADRVFVDVASSVNTADITISGPTRRDIVRCIQRSRELCGVLIAHDGLGVHLAVASGTQPHSGTASERVVLIPQRHVESLFIEKTRAHVTVPSQQARRKPLRARISDAVGG
jgi:hypothetical protein